MKTNANQMLPRARTSELVVRELPNEVLVYDLERDRAHCLNLSAALIWKHCDGKMTVAKMAQLLEQEFATPVDEQVVWLALQQLDKFRLLQERVTIPTNGPGVSRRDVVRRIGVAALVLPVIVSISVPTAAAVASCRPNGTGCTTFSQCCSSCCSAGTCKDPNNC